ncbi:MAG: hypothetical protein R3C26_06795 [Calditrichia bacterium]
MISVNGVGKTTSIAKIARRFQQNGKSAAGSPGDAFRAAAVEQFGNLGKPAAEWISSNTVPVPIPLHCLRCDTGCQSPQSRCGADRYRRALHTSKPDGRAKVQRVIKK